MPIEKEERKSWFSKPRKEELYPGHTETLVNPFSAITIKVESKDEIGIITTTIGPFTGFSNLNLRLKGDEINRLRRPISSVISRAEPFSGIKGSYVKFVWYPTSQSEQPKK